MRMFFSISTIKHAAKISLITFAVSIFFYGSQSVNAASLALSPATGVYEAGATFSVRILVNTEGSSINAAEGTLSFNPSELSVVAVSRASSIFGLWTQEPSFSNSAGTISFGGGSPTGYSGSVGSVVTVTFRAATAGTPKVSFSNGSVLAADGRGTNILRTMQSGAYTIAAVEQIAEAEQIIEYVAPPDTPSAPLVQADSHPDQEGWYTSTSSVLSWNLPGDIVAVRTLLDDSPNTIPTVVYDPPIDSKTLTDLPQGVSYFHVQFRNKNGWGRVAHYRLAVDSGAPERFSIAISEEADLSNPIQTLLFSVDDSTSEVNKFLIQIDGGEPLVYIDETGSSSYALPQLDPGNHTVVVEAFDAANNSVVATFSFTIEAFERPRFTEYPTEINKEVIPVIKGQTRPYAKVFVSLTPAGFTKRAEAAQNEYEVASDENGEFVFIPNNRLELGVYELSAVAVDQYGAKSERSDVVRIAVQQPGYLAIGSLLVSVLSIVVTLLGLVTLLVLIVLFVVRRIRTLRTRVHIEADEALSVFDEQHHKVMKVLESQASALAQSRKANKLTKNEEALVEDVTKTLVAMKKAVRKEISDVDEVVE